MKVLRYCIVLFIVTFALFCSGCGRSTDDRIKEARQIIDSLKTAGIPDSMLTEVEVLHYKAKTQQERGNSREAVESIEKVLSLLSGIKEDFASKSASAREAVDLLYKTMKAGAEKFSGERAETIHKSLKEVDSLLQTGLILNAHTQIRDLGAHLPELKQNEKRAKEIAGLVVAKWRRETVEKDEDVGSDFREVEEYIFRNNKSFVVTETNKGYRDEKAYLNYKYVSSGNYTLNGDTVKMWVKKMKGYNKNKALDEAKNEWRQVEEPPFDSLVTDGSQDRYQTYGELRQHFRKMRR